MTTDEQVERQLKEAFQNEHAPASLRNQTLQVIEERRASESRGYSTRRHRKVLLRIALPLAAAACLVLALIGMDVFRSGGDTETQMPSVTAPVELSTQAVVGIDINPSFELVVDSSDTVCEVRPLNADAETALSQVDIQGMRYDQALNEIFTCEAFKPYLGTDSLVEIDVVSDDDELASHLVAVGESALSTLPCEGVCMRSDRALYEDATAAGMGMGRYRTALELTSLDPSVTMEDCSHMSMREMRDRIDACSGDGEGPGSGQGCDSATGSSSDDDASTGGGMGHHGHGERTGAASGHGSH